MHAIFTFPCEQVDKKKAAEAAAVAASVRRLYRVREESGVEATRTPDIIAPAADMIEAGIAFYGKAEVHDDIIHYVRPWVCFGMLLFCV